MKSQYDAEYEWCEAQFAWREDTRVWGVWGVLGDWRRQSMI